MTAMLMDASKVAILTNMLAAQPFAAIYSMGLFTNDATPTEDMIKSDFTEPNPAVSIGYSSQAITGWGTPILVADGTAFADANLVTFTNSDNVDDWEEVFGWFTYELGTNMIVFAARFPTSFILPPLTSRRWVPAILLGQLAAA